MLEISVKTLDGQTRKFTVPDDMTVADFKERIAESVTIPAARQRVIFQGRLLANESRLGDLDLNGRAVHVVERAPPVEGQQQQSQPEPQGGQRTRPDFIMAGAFEVPPDIQQVVQQAVNQFGPAARGASVETRRMPGGAPGLEVHIRLPPPGSAGAASPQDRVSHEVNERIRIANKMLNLASHVVTSLENNVQMEAQPSTSADQPTSDSPTPPQPSTPPDPETGLMNALSNIVALNDRLKPLLDEFSQNVLSRNNQQEGEQPANERQRAARLSQAVPEILHHVAHAYHNLSDLVLDAPQPATGAAATAPSHRIAVSSSTVAPVQGVYQQVFTVPVVEIQTGGGHGTQPQQEPNNNGENRSQGGPQGGGQFVFAQRMPGQMFNPFSIFQRPPMAAMITNARPGDPNQGQNPADQNAATMVRPIDQNLPCLSRHFLAPHVIETARLTAQNAAQQQQQQQPGQQQQQQQQHPAPGGVDPANMMNMFQEITNFVMQAIVQAGAQGGQQQQQPDQQSRQPQQGIPGDFLNTVRQFASNVPETEPFGQIVRSLGQLFADPTGSANRTSAFDFIQGLGNVPPMAPSPINNLIEVVMRALPMSDFIRLIMGDTSPLARVHGPIRDHFINEMRSPDAANTTRDSSVIVEAIVNELHTLYDFVFAETATNDNIDLVASMTAHDRHWISRLVNLVVDTQPAVGPVESSNAPLYRQLYDGVLNAAHETVVLIVTAIGQENARPTMRRLVQRAIASMEQGGQAAELQSNFAVAALSDFADRLVAESPQRVPRSQIERFIVQRSPQAEAPVQVPTAFPVPAAPVQQASSPPRTAPVVDLSWVQPTAQERARASVLMTNHAEVSNGQAQNDDWRSVVPPEWVPVIEEDAVKQRSTEISPQPPVSDAYLSGLPAKRRRMAMEQRLNDPLAQGHISHGFADIMGQVLRGAGVPAAVAPALMEEATSSQELGGLFENEVLRQLRSRLASDPNFDPSRHPEIANFFNNRG